MSVLLLGPRGVGKTLLCREVLRQHQNVLAFDLLEPETYERYLKDRAQFERDITGRLRQNLVAFVDEPHIPTWPRTGSRYCPGARACLP